MAEAEQVDEQWVVRVTALVSTDPSSYKNFFIGVKGTEEQAEEMRKVIARKGFTVGGRRFFSDEIKNLVVKKDGEFLNE